MLKSHDSSRDSMSSRSCAWARWTLVISSSLWVSRMEGEKFWVTLESCYKNCFTIFFHNSLGSRGFSHVSVFHARDISGTPSASMPLPRIWLKDSQVIVKCILEIFLHVCSESGSHRCCHCKVLMYVVIFFWICDLGIRKFHNWHHYTPLLTANQCQEQFFLSALCDLAETGQRSAMFITLSLDTGALTALHV